MVMTDPIADMLTRIRNANSERHATVKMPSSKLKLEILKVLKDEGFIINYDFKADTKQGIITVDLKYTATKGTVINGLRRISKPGLRVYAPASKLPKVFNGLGIAVISTSKGIMTDRNARLQQVGGEVLAYIW